MPLLTVQNITKRYATQLAVDNISFDLPEGSIFGLLGPNGAGKSTLLRMITGIFYPDEGAILFEGQKLDSQIHPAHMGYMPEERGLYKKMKVGEQAVYLAQLRGLNKADAISKTKAWFEKLNMTSWWNKKVEDLSKGMSQKLQFVTTVVHDPKLLILDEPFSGLDPVNANVLKDEIYELAKKGTTIIFSTHRMEQVEEICDHIALINLGKKILDGSVYQVKQDFKENLFKLTTLESLEDVQLPDTIEILDRKDNAIVYHLNEGTQSNQVLSAIIAQQKTIHTFEEILPSLNDIFIKLVQGTPISRSFLN